LENAWRQQLPDAAGLRNDGCGSPFTGSQIDGECSRSTKTKAHEAQEADAAAKKV
jgi:hypothetical protein